MATVTLLSVLGSFSLAWFMQVMCMNRLLWVSWYVVDSAFHSLNLVLLAHVLDELHVYIGLVPEHQLLIWHTARLASPSESFDTDHTGEIISFSDVGPGAGTNPPRPWYCYTNDPGRVRWLFPNGDHIAAVFHRDVHRNELFISSVPGLIAVALHRGPDYFSPDGKHCCARNDGTLTRCVTFSECWLYCLCPIVIPTPTAPCPTLSPPSNGNISYDATTTNMAMATYTCDTGYTMTGTISSITCNKGTRQWSSTVRPTCERKKH